MSLDPFVGFSMLIISLIILYIAIKSATLECPRVIEYRYIPRTFEEEQKEPVMVSQIFKRMFEDATPRNGSFVGIDETKK
jgi:hypothetical protein